MLAMALSLLCSTVPQTTDPVPLIISPGTDGIATVTPEYNVSITIPIVVDANTTFTDVVRLYCPVGYNDTIGIANLTLNSDQIKELQIFVNYTNQKIILIHYRDGSIIQNNTFALYTETEAIMGISIIPAPTVINAGPIDSIYYNIFCSYELAVGQYPVASFTYSPDKPIVNETVTFNASASYDPDGTIVSYDWDFDDNTNGTGSITTHNYTTEGTYNVTLTVTDDDSLTNTTWKLVTVYTEVPEHDVAIMNVTTSANEVYAEQTVNITVIAKNNGTAVETFNVTVYYDDINVETQNVTYLLPDEETTLMFSWNTTGVTPCNNYTIKANATIISFVDTNPANNEFINGQVKIRIIGDVNGDGSVSVADMVEVDIALGTQPGQPNYDPWADVNGDGNISVADMVLIDIHLGEKCPP
jgi:PKD repeat protein